MTDQDESAAIDAAIAADRRMRWHGVWVGDIVDEVIHAPEPTTRAEEWQRAKDRIVARFGNYVLRELDDDEASVLFCGLVVKALGEGMTLEQIHRAVDSAARANGGGN